MSSQIMFPLTSITLIGERVKALAGVLTYQQSTQQEIHATTMAHNLQIKKTSGELLAG
jgi:hypothetical protein